MLKQELELIDQILDNKHDPVLVDDERAESMMAFQETAINGNVSQFDVKSKDKDNRNQEEY